MDGKEDVESSDEEEEIAQRHLLRVSSWRRLTGKKKMGRESGRRPTEPMSSTQFGGIPSLSMSERRRLQEEDASSVDSGNDEFSSLPDLQSPTEQITE